MSKKIYHQPHDKLVKRYMTDKRVAKEIIQQQLPIFLLDAIDFNSLKQEPTEFIDEKFKLKQADLIYSANFKGKKKSKTYFYFLCEHQSASEQLMAFTLLIYIVEIMKNHLEKHPENPLPIVYPIVLYANNKPWTAPTDIFKLFGHAESIAREIMFKPFTLIDVNRTSDNDLKSKKLSGLFQFALKYRQIKEFNKFFDTILPWINEVSTLNYGEDLAKGVLSYIMEGLETEDVGLLFEKSDQYFSLELRGEAMTIANALRKQGIQQGIQQGAQEKQYQIAVNLLRKGISMNTISEATGLSSKFLEELKEKAELQCPTYTHAQTPETS